MGIIYRKGGNIRSAMGGMRAPMGSGMSTPGVPSFNNQHRAPAMQAMPQVNPGITPAFQGGNQAPTNPNLGNPDSMIGEANAPSRTTEEFGSLYPLLQKNKEAYQKALYSTPFNWEGNKTTLNDLYTQYGGVPHPQTGAYNWEGEAGLGIRNMLNQTNNQMGTDEYVRGMADTATKTLQGYAKNNAYPQGMDYNMVNSWMGYDTQTPPPQQIPQQRRGGKFKKPLFH